MVSALEEGAKSIDFTKLVEWLTKELSGFYNIEEHANAISGVFKCYCSLYNSSSLHEMQNPMSSSEY